ncbi:MAG TPA: thioredoxin family protein [Phaeodactylibacter sp.]|nr:thioredoxin family protein [Phaeodactylibacter sp.]
MKKIIFLSLFVAISFIGYSQTTETYKAENEGWLVSIDEAYKLSKKTGKPILANFTGSDWCGWCKRLTKSVFAKESFKKWADKNVVLLELDFPRRKTLPKEIRQQNYQLQQVFKVSGYPTIWVFKLDKDDKGQFQIEGLGKTGYRKTVKEFTHDVDRMIARAK